MSKDLNLCQFIGRLGQDPELKYMPSGSAVVNLSLACGDSYKDKSGEKVEHTEWVRVSAFGKLAEIIGQYLEKGSQVYISGQMRTRKWQDQSGQDRYTTEIIARDMQMLGSKGDGGSRGGNDRKSAAQQDRSTQQSGGGSPHSDLDGDIPFAQVEWRVEGS